MRRPSACCVRRQPRALKEARRIQRVSSLDVKMYRADADREASVTVAKRSSRLNRRRSLREQRPSAVFHELEQSKRALKHQILAREHVETELRKIQSFFNALIESLPNFFLVKNAADGKVILVNCAAEDLFGDRIDLLGKTAVDIVPKLEAKSILDQDQDALRSCHANETNMR